MSMHYVHGEIKCSYKYCDYMLGDGDEAQLFEGDLFCDSQCAADSILDGLGIKSVSLTSEKIYMDGDW